MEQQNQQLNQQLNQTSIDEVKKEKSKRIKIVLFALAAVIFVVGGILLLKTTEPTPSPIPAVQTLPSAPSPQALDTSDWQTYRNEEFGFEVRYPSEEWKVMEARAKGDYSNIVWLFPKESIGESADPEIFMAIAYRSLEEEKQKREKSGIEYNYSKITVAGRDGYLSASLQGVHGEVKEALIDARNRQTFIISTQNAINIFDEILSTFRFTDQTTPPTSSDNTFSTTINGYYATCMDNSSVYKRISGSWEKVSNKLPSKGLYYLDDKFVGYGMCDLVVCQELPKPYAIQLVEYKKVGEKAPPPDSGSIGDAPVYQTIPLSGDIKIDILYSSDKNCQNKKTFSTIVER